jgi:hypothetical protein
MISYSESKVASEENKEDTSSGAIFYLPIFSKQQCLSATMFINNKIILLNHFFSLDDPDIFPR